MRRIRHSIETKSAQQQAITELIAFFSICSFAASWKEYRSIVSQRSNNCQFKTNDSIIGEHSNLY